MKKMPEEDQIITLDEMMTAVRTKVIGTFDLVVGIERGACCPPIWPPGGWMYPWRPCVSAFGTIPTSP
jgi:hypothetical protein